MHTAKRRQPHLCDLVGVVSTDDLGLVDGVDSSGWGGGSQGSLDTDGIGVNAALTGALGELNLTEGRVWDAHGSLDTDSIGADGGGRLTTLVDGKRLLLGCGTVLGYRHTEMAGTT
jgi:hypothetical protein